MEGKWGSPGTPRMEKNEASQRFGNNQGLHNHCPHLSFVYATHCWVTVYPHNSVLNTDCPPVSEGQGYVQSSWVPLAPDAFPGLSLHVTNGFPDLLPNSTWLLVAQAHSVVVSRVHALTGCWPETISGHRFLYEATHVMVTCFLQSWGTKGTQLQVGLLST